MKRLFTTTRLTVLIVAALSLLTSAPGSSAPQRSGTDRGSRRAPIGTPILGTARPRTQDFPRGLPAPSFGISQAVSSSPLRSDGTTGPYYVDASSKTATDQGNPYGTEARPRATIPTPLPAGAVVELHGNYPVNHTSPRGIVALGTSAAPVYIRGASLKARPTVTGCWEVTGTHYILENIDFAGCGSVVLLAPTDYGVLRHSEVHGTKSGGGVGVQSWNGLPVSNVVIWNNSIHDNGDINANYDQDVHGIAVSAHVSHLWVIDNELYRNSGDGIQINAGSAALQHTTHDIFVGRNVAHHNKQSGFWTKQAVDVIFALNTSYAHRPGNSSPGVCMGGQYAPESVWFINNTVSDCDYGIQLASDSDQGIGRTQFVIGNIVSRIHNSTGSFNAGTAWQTCGISPPGGTDRYVIANTLYDVDSGVCVPYDTGTVLLYDNVVQRIRSNGFHLMFDAAGMFGRTLAAGNLFAPNYRLGVAETTTTVGPQPPGPPGANNVVENIGWRDPDGGDFHLLSDSPARSNGVIGQLGVWDEFSRRYGTDLIHDIYGTERPSEKSDSGAVESAPAVTR